MPSPAPALRDLVTVLYRPRATMRRILDQGPDRWTSGLIVLAFLCISFADPKSGAIGGKLPDFDLTSLIGIVLLVMLVTSLCWIGIVWLLSRVLELTGKLLGGTGNSVDVRAAIAWGAVPLIWSVIYRIPAGIYTSRLALETSGPVQASINFIEHGGCGFVLVMLLVRAVFDVWTLFVTSATIAEAHRFETWKGFAAIVITAVIPLVIVAAALLANR